MGLQLEPIDQRILDLIDEVRAELGACTTGHVSARMGVSRDMIRVRCQMMREHRLVEWSSAAGSLRTVKPIGTKLYEQLVIRAVERQAERGARGEQVTDWCVTAIANARDTAWVVPVAEQESSNDGDEPSLVEDGMNPTSPHRDDQIACTLCERDFKTVTALLGHERSKAHIAKLNEIGVAPAA